MVEYNFKHIQTDHIIEVPQILACIKWASSIILCTYNENLTITECDMGVDSGILQNRTRILSDNLNTGA